MILQAKPEFASLFNRVLREKAVLERILILFRCAGTRRAAMHPAALFGGHRRRSAKAAGTGLGSASRARQHRPGVAEMIAGHEPDLRREGTG